MLFYSIHVTDTRLIPHLFANLFCSFIIEVVIADITSLVLQNTFDCVVTDKRQFCAVANGWCEVQDTRLNDGKVLDGLY